MSKENSVGQQKDVMTTLKNRKKGKKRIIIIVVIAVLVLLFVYVKQSMEKAMETVQETMMQVQTDEVSRRSLIKSVGATGTVVSIESKDVKASLSGVDIEQIKVEIGDMVTEGQELVVFDTTDIQESLESAKEQLSIAEQRNSLSAQDAKRNVENAQRAEQFQVDAAKTSMDKAYDNYEIAMVDYNNASKTLQNLKDNEGTAYNNYINAKNHAEALAVTLEEKEALVAEAEVTLEAMESVSTGDAAGYETAQREYETATAERNSIKQQYEEAAAGLPGLEALYLQAKASREAQEQVVNNLSDIYDAKTDSYNSSVKSYDNTVATQASNVASAKSSQKSTSLSADTSSQEKQVEQYQEQLDKGSLKAPLGGIVTAINFEEGDTYTQGAIITIQDCTAYEIEAEIGEYDISDIQLGQKVLIKTDATRDEELEGTVVFISPTATKSATNSGVTYTVRIAIDTPNDRLRLDMSASLSIIIEEHDNVFTVPYNAVQEDEEGNSFIELIEEDGITTTKLPITVVMESNYYTEITADGLEEGMKIKVIESEENMMFELMMEGGF